MTKLKQQQKETTKNIKNGSFELNISEEKTDNPFLLINNVLHDIWVLKNMVVTQKYLTNLSVYKQ